MVLGTPPFLDGLYADPGNAESFSASTFFACLFSIVYYRELFCMSCSTFCVDTVEGKQ